MKKTHKLTDLQKIEIVTKYKTGKYSCQTLGNEYNISNTGINGILKRRGVTINNNRSKLSRKYTLNERYFDVIDTEEKAYFLGLLYADGYNNEKKTSIVLALQESDLHILKQFNILIKSNRPLIFNERSTKNVNWKNIYTLWINSIIMSKQLAKLGCYQKKSLTLEFPTKEQVPERFLQHWLRGLFDGDGCVCLTTKHNKPIMIASLCSTIMLNKQVKDLIFNQCGVTMGIRLTKNKITSYIQTSTTNQSIQFLTWLYKDSTIHLTRKYDKFQDGKKDIHSYGRTTLA